MAETRTLLDRDEIRDWAAARAGSPAIRAERPVIGEDDPVLMIVFGQHSYQDQDQGADRPGGLELVEWDDWFKLFEERGWLWLSARRRPESATNFTR